MLLKLWALCMKIDVDTLKCYNLCHIFMFLEMCFAHIFLSLFLCHIWQWISFWLEFLWATEKGDGMSNHNIFQGIAAINFIVLVAAYTKQWLLEINALNQKVLLFFLSLDGFPFFHIIVICGIFFFLHCSKCLIFHLFVSMVEHREKKTTTTFQWLSFCACRLLVVLITSHVTL